MVNPLFQWERTPLRKRRSGCSARSCLGVARMFNCQLGWGRGGGGDEGWFLFGCFPQVYCKHHADYWGWLNYAFLSCLSPFILTPPSPPSLLAIISFTCIFFNTVGTSSSSFLVNMLQFGICICIFHVFLTEFRECVYEYCNWTTAHWFLEWGAEFSDTKNLSHIYTHTGAHCWFVSNSYYHLYPPLPLTLQWVKSTVQTPICIPCGSLKTGEAGIQTILDLV